MQKKLILFIAVFFSAQALIAQTFNVCNGSEVTFEMEDDYWGEPIWQYSSDSLNWESFPIDVTQPFVVEPGMSGYYRLLMVDESCDSSYVSQVEKIEVREPLSLVSIIQLDSIPLGTDPYVWIDNQENLQDVSFHSLENSYNAQSQFFPFPGEEQDFFVYATATDSELGCELVSDTLYFSVFNPVRTTTVSVNLGSLDLANLSAVTSIDSVSVSTGQDFNIQFDAQAGVDFIYTMRTNFGVDTSIVAINVVDLETVDIEVSTFETAISLVLISPEIGYHIWNNYQNLRTAIQDAETLQEVITIIEGQYGTEGHLNLEDENLEFAINTLIEEISEQETDGLIEDLGIPYLSNNGAVLGMNFNSNDVNLFHVVRMYFGDNPVSKMIPIPGDLEFANSGASQLLLNMMMNISTVNFELSQIKFEQQITPEDLLVFDANRVRNFKTRIVNGRGAESLDGYDEQDLARSLNIAYMTTFIIASAPNLMSKALKEGASLVENIYNAVSNPISQSLLLGEEVTPSAILETLTSIVGAVTGLLLTAGIITNPLFGVAVATITAVNVGKIILQARSMIYDYYYNGEGDYYFLCTQVGSRIIADQLQIHRNHYTLDAVPGSYTTQNAEFSFFVQLKAFQNFEEEESEENYLYESDIVAYDNVSGFSISGSTLNTESIEFGGETYTNEIFELSSLGHFNEIKWKVSPNIMAPNNATLDLVFKYNNVTVASLFEPLQETYIADGQLTYLCAVTPPTLAYISGDNQYALAGEDVPEDCVVRITTPDGQGVPDGYMVDFEVIDGGGAITLDQITQTTVPTYTIDTLSGYAGVKWYLGEDGDQVLRASVKDSEDNIIDSYTFQGNIGIEPYDFSGTWTIKSFSNTNPYGIIFPWFQSGEMQLTFTSGGELIAAMRRELSELDENDLPILGAWAPVNYPPNSVAIEILTIEDGTQFFAIVGIEACGPSVLDEDGWKFVINDLNSSIFYCSIYIFEDVLDFAFPGCYNAQLLR